MYLSRNKDIKRYIQFYEKQIKCKKITKYIIKFMESKYKIKREKEDRN